MIYITGDTHRKFTRILFFNISKQIFYWRYIDYIEWCRNKLLWKENRWYVEKITFSRANYVFCVLGNHEKGPQASTYKEKVLKAIKTNKVDMILSHTCPYKYLAYKVFLPRIDQSKRTFFRWYREYC